MLKNVNLYREYQPLIPVPPLSDEELHHHTTKSDGITVKTWHKTWITNLKKNKEFFGDFGKHSFGQLYGKHKAGPAIIMGAGPSVKDSLEALKMNKGLKNPVPTISCLHNYGYLEDEGVHADYYVTLDAGELIFQDIFEGRQHDLQHYMDTTKDKILIASIHTPTKLFEMWQGKIYLFNSMVPDAQFTKEANEVATFSHYISAGGNVLGGCFYIARAVFGASTIMFVGADFCFDYDKTFHSYKTQYDATGQYIKWPDVFGIPRLTWPSYTHFKLWFDRMAGIVPGHYINCSEGILGAYKEGNISAFEYKTLEAALTPYVFNEYVYLDEFSKETGQRTNRTQVSLEEIFKDPQHKMNITFF